jgi:hypothetical protein
MSRRASAKSEPTPLASPAVQASPAPKDGGMMPRATNADSSLPSGPRNQPQIGPSRETSQADLRNSARLPPSGPSAGSTGRLRRNDQPFNAKQPSSAPRDRNTMEVDTAPPARPPPLRINDIPIRANSGMYADREPQRAEINSSTDAAPRGPRAMTRMGTSTSLTSFAPSPSTSPTTPLYSQRPPGVQDRAGSRLVQRSSPPHLVANNGFQTNDGPQAGLSAGGMPRQTIPARRASSASERGQPKQGRYQEVESRELVCPN